MPRRPRFVLPDVAHHITQRGNHQQNVFLNDTDRTRYLDILSQHAHRHSVRILGWCLMTNHVHLIAIPSAPESLSLTFGEAHSRYTLELNRQHNWQGHLWQGRFYSCPLDEFHLITALSYVEQNPVRAGIVPQAWEWPWSSARVHTNVSARDILLTWDWPNWMKEVRLGEWHHADWKLRLANERPTTDELHRIRRATKLGEPLGHDSFVTDLERTAGRRLRVWPQGRPAKKGTDDNT